MTSLGVAPHSTHLPDAKELHQPTVVEQGNWFELPYASCCQVDDGGYLEAKLLQLPFDRSLAAAELSRSERSTELVPVRGANDRLAVIENAVVG